MEAERRSPEGGVLVLAPTPRDAALIEATLDRAGIANNCCAGIEEACEELERGAEALLLAEEIVFDDTEGCLARWVARQPSWSDLPILVLARPGAESAVVSRAMAVFGNVTVLERPMRIATLVSAVRSALRARRRQYEVRDQLVQRERDLRELALYAAIVESSDDAIASKALDGRILSWNAGAERLFGYSAEEAVGRPITLVIPPERHGEELLLLERLRHGEHVQHFETVRVAKDGRRIEVSLTLSPIRDARGEIVGSSSVSRDITQKKQDERALREADRRKDEFLAILAHELRNPLAPILNSLHILRRIGDGNPTAVQVQEMMERQLRHIVRLVDDLLEVSRITGGKIELRKEPVEVGAIVRSAIETSRPQIDAARHRLTVSIPDEPLILEADPVRLIQVVANVLNNAAKYTEEGGQIWVTVRREGTLAEIAVRDSGIGIPADVLPHVFEMFMQSTRPGMRSKGGLGIGLMLVRNLVDLHGGSVEARSSGPGRGSEFVVRLPLSQSRCTPAARDREPRSEALAGRRALVVDDNRDSAESLGVLLRLLGAEVGIAYGGPEALAVLETYRPDVVLLDIGMPEMNGYEVARRIRERHGSEVTLIALTGWGQEEDRRRSHVAGFDHHMTKPADLQILEGLLVPRAGRGRPQ